MKCHVILKTGERVVAEGVPQCGHDFCDTCGDCLHCYGGVPCYVGETDEHFWVKYEEDGE